MINKSKIILLITVLSQSSILIATNFTLFASKTIDILFQNLRIFNIIIVITTILSLLSINKISDIVKKEVELDSTKQYVKSINELLQLFRMQRHEYINHIQAISSLNSLKEYEKLQEYVDGISRDFRNTSELIKLGDPILTSVINTKKEVAEEKGISFNVVCRSNIDLKNIPSWELSSIISNLIENAIEESSQHLNKWIRINIMNKNGYFIFKIENSGSIKKEIKDSLLEQGVSSKKAGGERGFGLFIVNKIVKKYNGSISYKNTNDGVQFVLSFPI